MTIKGESIITPIKLQIADIIINLNVIESKISDIISKYVRSERDEFVREVLLNSLIINFTSKVNVLRYILKAEEIDTPKDLFKAIQILATKRNIIAHSESLLKLEQDVADIDYEWDNGEMSLYPIYELGEPNIPIINDGNVNYEAISKIASDFSKYFDIASGGLQEIEDKLFKDN